MSRSTLRSAHRKPTSTPFASFCGRSLLQSAPTESSSGRPDKPPTPPVSLPDSVHNSPDHPFPLSSSMTGSAHRRQISTFLALSCGRSSPQSVPTASSSGRPGKAQWPAPLVRSLSYIPALRLSWCQGTAAVIHLRDWLGSALNVQLCCSCRACLATLYACRPCESKQSNQRTALFLSSRHMTIMSFAGDLSGMRY